MSAEAEADTADDQEPETNTEAFHTGGFKAIVDVGTLDAYLDILGALVEEAIIELTEDGLHTRANDPGNVALVDVTLPAAEFESYTANGGILGIDIATLKNAIGLASGKDALVTLELNAETYKVDVSGHDFNYAVAPIDPDAIRSRPGTPDLPRTNTIDIDAGQLKRAASGVDLVDDHLKLLAHAEEGELHVIGDGDTDDLEFYFGEDDLYGTDIEEDTETLLSLDYVEKTVAQMAGTVTVTLSGEFPGIFEFERAGTTAEYTIAPRVQRD
ncbi:DNA polymerase sliding clamp [Haloarchaeobius sp. DYHT-AS-18]|uniref:DNA polymerase sliding clamp n=1 Tax=Haloarchaeobius sp. DYHT-AS-18 TaxID=3446117 RepID=UPI003EB7E42D